MTESEMQEWFEERIQAKNILDSISNVKEIKDTIKSWNGINQIPPFSIDYLMRKKCYLAAESVLDSFHDLVLVSSDTSISKTVGEILRPDLVCFSMEQNVIVLFELKENSQTARQTMTELLAYEHEIKNQLPFLSFTDIYYVVVSTEWSTLMEHSLAALNTWSGHKVLGLLLQVQSNKWQLTPHIPNAWSYIRANGLPPGSLYTLNLCLYPKGKVANIDEPPYELFTAREMVGRKGEQIHSTGFTLAWENTFPDIIAKWILTVGVIHPIAFYHHSRIHGDENRLSEFTTFLNDKDLDHDSNPPQALYEVVKEAKNYLNDKWDVRIENHLDWESQRQNISQISIPLYGDFFGELYDYSLQRFTPSKTMIDWTDHRFVIGLLDELTHHKPLKDGVFRCSDLFKIGATISKFKSYRDNIEINDGKEGQKIWIGKYKWACTEICQQIQDVVDLNIDSKYVEPLDLPNNTSLHEVVDLFLNWISNDLLKKLGDNAHQAVFWLGTNVGIFLDDFFTDSVDVETLPEEWKDNTVEKVILNLLNYAFENESQNFPGSDIIDNHRTNLTDKGFTTLKIPSLIKQGKQTKVINTTVITLLNFHLIPLLDSVIDAVPLMYSKGKFQNVDWNYLKDGAKKLFQSGDLFPSITFMADGTLGVTPGIELAKLNILQPVSDPGEAVYFIDELAGTKIAVLKEWDEIAQIVEKR